MSAPFKTVVIGFGKIASGFSEDPVMARHFRYATHAQVLRDHPAFSWEAVVDPSDAARAIARGKWGVPLVFRDVSEIPDSFLPEVAVLATPPGTRLRLVERFPSLKAVFVEKPLGTSLCEARTFLDACEKRGIAVQVNFWRRGDRLFRELAGGRLEELVGRAYGAFGIYGNGFRNNGSHMIDFARMLFGEVEHAEPVRPEWSFKEGPLPEDRNIQFHLVVVGGAGVSVHPIPFSSYREVGIDIWGEKGRLSILQEGLGIYLYPRAENRAIRNEWEIASDCGRALEATCGDALFRMYDNLAGSLSGREALWSPGRSALATEEILHSLLEKGWRTLERNR